MPDTPKRPFPVGRLLFLLFVVLPIAELSILVALAVQTSFWFTLGVVLTTAMIGSTMLKRQGLTVLREAQTATAQGRFPGEQILEGVVLLVGGVMLITPGLITDALGLLALFPPTRRIFTGILKVAVLRGMASGSIKVVHFGAGFGMPRPNPTADSEIHGGPAPEVSGNPFQRRSPYDKS